MTIEEKISEEIEQGTTYPLRANHLVAFAVLADLKLAQRNAEINPSKISELVVKAKDMKFGFYNRTLVFDLLSVAPIKYWPCSGLEVRGVIDHINDLYDVDKLAVKLGGRYIAKPECLDEFRKVVNQLYQERPDVAIAYTKLVGSSPEKFFHPEIKEHYV